MTDSRTPEGQVPVSGPPSVLGRSCGPDWDAAVEYGIDVTLIERNLQLTVTQRLQQLEDMLATYFALRR
jgi:hypothetical protein